MATVCVHLARAVALSHRAACCEQPPPIPKEPPTSPHLTSISTPQITDPTAQVKPDGVERGLSGRIISRFEDRGLALEAAKFVKADPALLKEHYGHIAHKPFFPALEYVQLDGAGGRGWGIWPLRGGGYQMPSP